MQCVAACTDGLDDNIISTISIISLIVVIIVIIITIVIIIIITRSFAALRAADLHWIVGP